MSVDVSARWLVLDTSTPVAVVGVVDVTAGIALSEERITEARRHAEGLLEAIDRALASSSTSLAQLAGVAAGRGPGSFIGVRTGIATAKGLCLGRGLPLVGLPTLLALAESVDEGTVSGRGLAVVDAKRGELYVQLVERDAGGAFRALEEPRAITPADASARAANAAFVIGNVAAIGAVPPECRTVTVAAPSALGLARVLRSRVSAGVVDELATLVPDYCRAPDAKLPAVDPGARRALALE